MPNTVVGNSTAIQMQASTLMDSSSYQSPAMVQCQDAHAGVQAPDASHPWFVQCRGALASRASTAAHRVELNDE